MQAFYTSPLGTISPTYYTAPLDSGYGESLYCEQVILLNIFPSFSYLNYYSTLFSCLDL